MIEIGLTNIFGIKKVQFNKIFIEQYLQNVCGSHKKIIGIVYPTTEKEIIQLIYFSRNNNLPLYPISTGKNYGLGSRLPIGDDHLIVDLGKMNRILEFDADLGIIKIQPGVTQQDLALYLEKQNAEFILNVTGSAAESSIIGNALEKGVGHYGPRVSEVINIDIILGNGNKLSTNNLNHIYPYGLGPDLKGLFFQSNFGIVTSMTLSLIPKSTTTVSIIIEKKPPIPIESFINQLRRTKQKNILPNNLHISNQARRLSILTPLIARQFNITKAQARLKLKDRIHPDWTANSSIRGEKMILENQVECLKSYLTPYATINAIFDSDFKNNFDPFLQSTKGTFGHALGIPCSDALLSVGYELNQKLEESIENSTVGTLFLIPILPFRGSDFSKVIECISHQFQQHAFTPYMTFNLIENNSLEGVINLLFNKEDTITISKAHSCIQKTFNSLEDLGYPPMRLSIFQKSRFLNKDSFHQQIRQQLKTLFDPNNIIAKGRYE